MKNNLERLIKQTVPFKSDYIKAELGLIYVSSLLSNQSFQYYKQYNLSPQQYNILRILRGQFPRAINISSIKERMLDRMSDVSRIAERLCRMGLIIKQPNVIDKRNADITISEKGLEGCRVEGHEDAAKGVVARGTVWHFHELQEKILLSLSVLLDCNPVVRATNDRKHGDQQDVLQRMPTPTGFARVGQLREQFKQRRFF